MTIKDIKAGCCYNLILNGKLRFVRAKRRELTANGSGYYCWVTEAMDGTNRIIRIGEDDILRHRVESFDSQIDAMRSL